MKVHILEHNQAHHEEFAYSEMHVAMEYTSVTYVTQTKEYACI